MLRELRDAGAADERDVRAVLSSCGEEMDEAAVARLLRACEGRRAKDRTWCASPPPSPRRNRARGDPSPRRPPSITASRRRGTRDRARRRLRKKVDDARRRRRERWIRTGDEPKRARRHPHESRVNEGSTTTRRFVPPPRVSSSFDDFLRVCVTVPSRRRVRRRAPAAGKSPSRITEPRVHEILRIFVVREEIPAHRARLRFRLVARVFVLVREERRAAGKVPRDRRRFGSSARVVARPPLRSPSQR